MARFTGSGTFTLTGDEARIHDVIFESGPTLAISGDRATVRNAQMTGGLSISGAFVEVSDSSLRDVSWSGSDGLLTSSYLAFGAMTVTGDRMRILSNAASGYDDISITADHGLVEGNVFYNTFSGKDSIVLDGNRNLVTANKFVPSAGFTKSAVNITGGECNMVVGNDLGDKDDYTTDALIDAGANTQLFYPADATYGDNFTDCGTGS